MNKPPIGLIPRRVRERERTREIIEAMLRYHDSDEVIPGEWIDELREIQEREYNQQRRFKSIIPQ